MRKTWMVVALAATLACKDKKADDSKPADKPVETKPAETKPETKPGGEQSFNDAVTALCNSVEKARKDPKWVKPEISADGTAPPPANDQLVNDIINADVSNAEVKAAWKTDEATSRVVTFEDFAKRAGVASCPLVDWIKTVAASAKK